MIINLTRADLNIENETQNREDVYLESYRCDHLMFDSCSESGEMCAMKEVTLFADDAKSRESAKQLMQVI